MPINWTLLISGASMALVGAVLFYLNAIGKLKIPKKKGRKKEGAIDIPPEVAFGLLLIFGVLAILKSLSPLIETLRLTLFR